jgi:ferritin-like protein
MSTQRYPTKEAIEQVMKETGMEYMQAYYHLVARYTLQDRASREISPRTMGKSNYDER